ncbi:MAG: hypothetical protein S4CHLAM45_11700 [Chlamydiales bacterium]|nr:hypothetical protein [Chlamydiales bacterium]MCH9619662.1 hypothetical protein [Chlamydiales bacterium]MCH9623268.1 hypothetical protein [Chlamydiales bacterium]
MFGMEKGKREPGVAALEFDLEADLKDPGKLKALKERLEERIAQLKTLLRQGSDKQAFDNAQTLLHGYLAIQKVVARFSRKMT